jgi:glycogen operon protein
MLLGGDEFRRSQRGNNNAYCQDNDTSWVDWSLLQRNKEIFRFARGVLALRRMHAVLRREAFYTEEDLQWFAPDGNSPDWFDCRQKCLACLIRGQDGPDLYLMFNAESETIAFAVPPPRFPCLWRLAADTAESSPYGFYSPGEEVALANPVRYFVQARSSVILVAR